MCESKPTVELAYLHLGCAKIFRMWIKSIHKNLFVSINLFINSYSIDHKGSVHFRRRQRRRVADCSQPRCSRRAGVAEVFVQKAALIRAREIANFNNVII